MSNLHFIYWRILEKVLLQQLLNYLNHNKFCICQSFHLSIFPSVNLSISQSFHLSIFPSPNLSISQSFHLPIFPSVNPSICQSFHLSIFPFVNLSICQSFHLSTFPSLNHSICQSAYQSHHSTETLLRKTANNILLPRDKRHVCIFTNTA